MTSIQGSIKLGFAIGAVAVIAALAGFAGVRYTSQTTFCGSCHEMNAMHSGWTKGSHAEIHCYECHVDKNLSAQVIAKLNGLRQLLVHLTREVNMDNVTAEVPNERCARCHEMANKDKLGERIVTAHLKHREAKLQCTGCHLNTGHSREAFVGFKSESCVECHSRKPQEKPNPYLKRPPCTRPPSAGISAL